MNYKNLIRIIYVFFEFIYTVRYPTYLYALR